MAEPTTAVTKTGGGTADSLSLVPSERPGAAVAASAPPAERLGLLPAEQTAVTALVADSDAPAAAQATKVRATALASPDGPAVRRRALSRALAVAEQQMMQLHALLAAAVAHGKLDVLPALDRAATGAARRYALLAEAHRVDGERAQRPAVFVAAAGDIHVGGGHDR